MPTTDAQGRTISDDGQWWWDGTAWQPIKKGFFDTELPSTLPDLAHSWIFHEIFCGESHPVTAARPMNL